MRRSAIDEAEHRRGLILGLTLAEVLLLLLFLVLLALAAMFETIDRQRRDISLERDTIRADRDAIRGERDTLLYRIKVLTPSKGAGGLSPDVLLSRLDTLAVRAGTLEANNEQLRKENATLRSELWAQDASAAHLKKVVAKAATFDPNDPPGLLTRALEVLETIGIQTTPEQVKALLEAAEMENVAKGKEDEHDWPPIITLSEADGQFFQSGSADLPPGLETKLRGPITDRLLAAIKEYKVDVIEVLGHTDEQPLILRGSNLDRSLLPYLRGLPSDKVIPADNAGLGLARAVSVVRMLVADSRLKAYRILPLSGGQVISVGDQLSDGTMTAPADARRRIEIRLRRSTVEPPQAHADWQSTTVPASEIPATTGSVPKP